MRSPVWNVPLAYNFGRSLQGVGKTLLPFTPMPRAHWKGGDGVNDSKSNDCLARSPSKNGQICFLSIGLAARLSVPLARAVYRQGSTRIFVSSAHADSAIKAVVC